MPKPLHDQPGSGMHVHQSLFDFEGNNLFFDPDDPTGCRLSKLAKHYLAGLLRYAREFCLVTNPNVNSYKRLVPGSEAPVHVTWARNNRSTLVRIPGTRPNKAEACRLELRGPDPSANPYLAFAVMLAAGLKGIEDELELEPPCDDPRLFLASRQTLAESGILTLPDTLGEAVEIFAQSDFMREVLGDHIHGFLVDAKREEWNDYQRHISSWEFDRYLSVL
jgi:glutamine synthetase